LFKQAYLDRAGGAGHQQGRRWGEFCMNQVINLRTARKQAKRRQAEQEAAQNRLAHGRSQAERQLDRSQNEQARRKLDQHRIESKET
jgi:hypothetical protein